MALTYTLEEAYGAKCVVAGAGFLLNNEMGDFNVVPDERTCRAGSERLPNVIAPHKRMLSSQTPTLLLKEGRVRIVTGSPGGRTIPNTVLWVVLNLAEFGLAPQRGRRRLAPTINGFPMSWSWKAGHGATISVSLTAMGQSCRRAAPGQCEHHRHRCRGQTARHAATAGVRRDRRGRLSRNEATGHFPVGGSSEAGNHGFPGAFSDRGAGLEDPRDRKEPGFPAGFRITATCSHHLDCQLDVRFSPGKWPRNGVILPKKAGK